jgi:hypothetical protein
MLTRQVDIDLKSYPHPPLETRARIATNNRRNVSRLTAKFTPRLRAMFRRHGEIVANAYKQRALPALDERGDRRARASALSAPRSNGN